MQNQYHRAVRLCFMILMTAVPLSCSQPSPVSPTATPMSTSSPEEATATTVPPLQAPDLPTDEPTASSPRQQEIELRFIDPGSQEECVAHFPFEILGEGEQRSISGGGVIDCRFEIQQCGERVCVTYHSTYYLDGDLSGFIQKSTPSYPDGALEVYLAGTFTMKQWWTDIPPETVMAYTEANPFEVSSSDIIPLFFHFADGATQEVGNTGAPNAHPWVFTLHLE
jgi:hypothetical protein